MDFDEPYDSNFLNLNKLNIEIEESMININPCDHPKPFSSIKERFCITSKGDFIYRLENYLQIIKISPNKSNIMVMKRMSTPYKLNSKYVMADPPSFNFINNAFKEYTVTKIMSTHPSGLNAYDFRVVVLLNKKLLVTEFLMEHGGVQLPSLINSIRKNPQQIINILEQLSNFLHYLEAIKISHNDIKLSNLLLNDKNVLKIIDYDASQTTSFLISTKKGINTSLGYTAGFVSPEMKRISLIDQQIQHLLDSQNFIFENDKNYQDKLKQNEVKINELSLLKCDADPWKSDVYSWGIVALILTNVLDIDNKILEQLDRDKGNHESHERILNYTDNIDLKINNSINENLKYLIRKSLTFDPISRISCKQLSNLMKEVTLIKDHQLFINKVNQVLNEKYLSRTMLKEKLIECEKKIEKLENELQNDRDSLSKLELENKRHLNNIKNASLILDEFDGGENPQFSLDERIRLIIQDLQNRNSQCKSDWTNLAKKYEENIKLTKILNEFINQKTSNTDKYLMLYEIIGENSNSLNIQLYNKAQMICKRHINFNAENIEEIQITNLFSNHFFEIRLPLNTSLANTILGMLEYLGEHFNIIWDSNDSFIVKIEKQIKLKMLDKDNLENEKTEFHLANSVMNGNESMLQPFQTQNSLNSRKLDHYIVDNSVFEGSLEEIKSTIPINKFLPNRFFEINLIMNNEVKCPFCYNRHFEKNNYYKCLGEKKNQKLNKNLKEKMLNNKFVWNFRKSETNGCQFDPEEINIAIQMMNCVPILIVDFGEHLNNHPKLINYFKISICNSNFLSWLILSNMNLSYQKKIEFLRIMSIKRNIKICIMDKDDNNYESFIKKEAFKLNLIFHEPIQDNKSLIKDYKTETKNKINNSFKASSLGYTFELINKDIFSEILINTIENYCSNHGLNISDKESLMNVIKKNKDFGESIYYISDLLVENFCNYYRMKFNERQVWVFTKKKNGEIHKYKH